MAMFPWLSPRYHTGPVSDHFDGQRFVNRYGPTTDRTLADIWRWRRQSTPAPWPAPVHHLSQDHPPQRSTTLRVTLVGHATLLIQVAGVNILADPVWSDRAGPLGLAGPRRHTPLGIDFARLPPIDVILLTHSHYDHMDAATLKRLWARDPARRPRLVAPLGNDAVIRRAAGLPAHTGDWHDRVALSDDVAAEFWPANHWSARTPFDRRRALWCGYALHTPAGLVYLAGDTGYGTGQHFALLRRRLGPPLLAILPIGAYEPRWFMRPQHMNPAEAVQACLDCGATHALGVHWGTFRLTDEPRDAPLAALAAARAAAGMPPSRFAAMHPGQVWQPGPHDALTPPAGFR